jgi:5-methylthioribose kinase
LLEDFDPKFDIERPGELELYLKKGQHVASDERLNIQLLEGGVSNRTVLVERQNGEAWVIKQALEKLRVKLDWYSSPQRIHREALGLQWLTQLAPGGTIPRFIFEDFKYHLLAMQAVPRPHSNWKTMLLAGDLELRHVEQFGFILGTIHRKASQNQAQLAPLFADRSFFESLRIEPYYQYSATQVPQAVNFFNTLIQDTLSRRLTLVHGDYSPKNILVYQDRLVLLDFEVIHFGDPAFDLGFSLTHFLSKAHHLTPLRSKFAEAAFYYWKTYLATIGDLDWSGELEERVVRHTLGCLLARVVGRSPLEYLSDFERQRQLETVLSLISNPPQTLSNLIAQFVERI